MVRQLLESDVSAVAGKGGLPGNSPGTSTLPPTLQAVIMTRIDSLEPEDRRSLQTASVIGRTFQQSILERVIDPPGQDLSRSLEELLRRDFLRPVDTDNGAVADTHPHRTYAFAHTLTHEMAYTSLLLARRRELHGRIAETIEELHGARGEEYAEALAHHYEAAGLKGRAFQFLLKAADRNKRLYANHEATACYEKALEFADELGTDGGIKRGIHEGLGDVLTVHARYPRALQHYQLARELAQHPQQRALLLRKMGEVLERTGRYDEAVRHLEAAMAELRADFDTAEAARVYTDLGLVQYRRREFQAAIELNLLAVDLMTGSADRRGMARIWNNLGIAYAGSGDFARAEEFHARALSLWNELGDTHGRAASHNNLGMLCSQQERWDEAMDHFQTSLTLCERMGNLHGLARICDNLGELHARRGDTAAGMEYLQKAVSLLASIGSESSDGMPEMWLQSGTW